VHMHAKQRTHIISVDLPTPPVARHRIQAVRACVDPASPRLCTCYLPVACSIFHGTEWYIILPAFHAGWSCLPVTYVPARAMRYNPRDMISPTVPSKRRLLPPFFNIRRRSIPRSKKFRHGNFSSFQLYPPCRVGVSLLSLRLCRSLSLPSIAAHPWPSSLPSLPSLSPPPPFSVLESHLAPHHHVITRRNHLLSQSKVVL
jgi:hypothetical protein